MNKLPDSLLAFFWFFIKKQPISFLLFFLAPVAMILETNVVPYSLKLLIDKIVEHENDKIAVIKEILPAACLGLSAWLGFIVITRLQNWFQSQIIPKVEADIRTTIFHYVLFHSYDYFANQLEGNIANKISDLPRSLESIRMILCWNVLSTMLVVLVTLIMTAKINLIFTLILGAWVMAHLMITFYFVKLINKLSQINAEDKSTLSGTVTDTISNIVSVKHFANWYYEIKYFAAKQDQEKQSNTRLMKLMNIFQVCIDIPVTIMLVSTLYYLIINWQKAIISIGDFIFIFNMIYAITYQMWHLSNALIDLFRQIGIAQQALILITTPRQIIDKIGSKLLNAGKGEIIFENVSFGYSNNNILFKNQSITIPAGQKLGLVGFSGAGKSSFINLILRFFDIQLGKITINNQDITQVTQDSLRKAISVIPQDVILFHRSVMENIRYGHIDASDEEVIAASKEAHCHDFIMRLSEGYNTLVGERGIKLSGGQRQRIAIARAILKNAPILILDEATSSLDSITEKYIQSALLKLMNKRTVIVIAHRLSTLSLMDRIVVLDNGSIVEDGTHDELLNRNGHYSIMWSMQIEGFLPQNNTKSSIF
jgi:ABC-type multidrug transport system fused ATPase/permease subunit